MRIPSPDITTQTIWDYGAIPSESVLCPATAAAHWDGSQSNTAYSSRPVYGIPHPNPWQNSSESCTSWWVRTRPRIRGWRIDLEELRILDCWIFWDCTLGGSYTRWWGGTRGGSYSSYSVQRCWSHLGTPRIPLLLRSIGGHLQYKWNA